MSFYRTGDTAADRATNLTSDSRATLAHFGVETLTGEAEGVFGLGRMLCDLNARGVSLFQQFLGGNVQFIPESNWNSTVGGEPAVASIMATRSLLREFVLFAAASEVAEVLVLEPIKHNSILSGELYACERPGDARALLEECPWLRDDYDVRVIAREGTAGDRNRHEMSGRAV